MIHERICHGEHFYEVSRDVRGRIVQMRKWPCSHRGCGEVNLAVLYLFFALMGVRQDP